MIILLLKRPLPNAKMEFAKLRSALMAIASNCRKTRKLAKFLASRSNRRSLLRKKLR